MKDGLTLPAWERPPDDGQTAGMPVRTDLPPVDAYAEDTKLIPADSVSIVDSPAAGDKKFGLTWIEDAAPQKLELEIERLALLSVLDYEQVRKQESRRLEIRAPELDKAVKAKRPKAESQSLALPTPEPWAEPVGSEIGQELLDVIHRHLVVPDKADIAISLWVLHAHAFDAAEVSPNLALTSPEKQCGKSTVLDMLHRLVPSPLPTANITPAAIFRAIDQY